MSRTAKQAELWKPNCSVVSKSSCSEYLKLKARPTELKRHDCKSAVMSWNGAAIAEWEFSVNLCELSRCLITGNVQEYRARVGDCLHAKEITLYGTQWKKRQSASDWTNAVNDFHNELFNSPHKRKGNGPPRIQICCPVWISSFLNHQINIRRFSSGVKQWCETDFSTVDEYW